MKLLHFFIIICALFLIACSSDDSGTSAAEETSSSVEISSSCSSDDAISSAASTNSVASKVVIDSWSKLDFNVDPNHIFGDISITTWPDDILEIGMATMDSSLIVAEPNIPLIDMVSGAYYRNYMKNSNYARTFRITVEDVEGMDKESILIRVSTKNGDDEVYSDVPPVDMTFYNVGKEHGKIYYQHYSLKGEDQGKPVLFSQRAEDAGDFEEAYVLVLKTSATDKFHFVKVEDAQ